MRSAPEPMPTVPETAGWRRGAIRLRAIPERAFMGLIDGEGRAWEAYLPLARGCRPGSTAWTTFVKLTAPERAAFSSYEHRLVEVEGEWWYAERYFVIGADGQEVTNLEVATGLEQRLLRAHDTWTATRTDKSP